MLKCVCVCVPGSVIMDGSRFGPDESVAVIRQREDDESIMVTDWSSLRLVP